MPLRRTTQMTALRELLVDWLSPWFVPVEDFEELKEAHKAEVKALRNEISMTQCESNRWQKLYFDHRRDFQRQFAADNELEVVVVPDRDDDKRVVVRLLSPVIQKSLIFQTPSARFKQFLQSIADLLANKLVEAIAKVHPMSREGLRHRPVCYHGMPLGEHCPKCYKETGDETKRVPDPHPAHGY